MDAVGCYVAQAVVPGSAWYLSAVGATLSRSLYLFLHGTLTAVAATCSRLDTRFYILRGPVWASKVRRSS